MAKHSWTNRTVPPLVVVTVVGCVWYVLQSRPNPIVTIPVAKASTHQSNIAAKANAQLTPSNSPTIKKLGAQVQFSINPLRYKNVQKVEFYVESQFVGAAYSQPYSVAVSENNLTAGTHTVVAKIYTMDATAQSQPATFQAQPTTPPAPAIDLSDADGITIASNNPIPPTDNDGDDTPTLPPVDPTPSPTLATPSSVTAVASDDGTSATINWTGSDGATGYQIWRDGSQVAITTGTGFTDTALNPGQTYDYQIVAIDTSSGFSDQSDMVAVTMPTSPPLDSPSDDTQSAQAEATQATGNDTTN